MILRRSCGRSVGLLRRGARLRRGTDGESARLPTRQPKTLPRPPMAGGRSVNRRRKPKCEVNRPLESSVSTSNHAGTERPRLIGPTESWLLARTRLY